MSIRLLDCPRCETTGKVRRLNFSDSGSHIENCPGCGGRGGVLPIPETAFDQGVEEGAREERKAIVAWLRGEVEKMGYVPGMVALKIAANEIESGEHLAPAAKEDKTT